MTDGERAARHADRINGSHPDAAALQAEWAYLRAVIDTAPSLIFAKDWEGHFTLANRAMAEIYGTTPETLLGKTDNDFNPDGEQVEHFLRADRQVIETGRPLLIVEEPVTNPQSGDTRWFQTRKVLLLAPDGTRQVLGVSTDITKSKQAEAEIRKARQEAEELAHELQGQAAQLEEQAADLEIANEELSAAEGRLRAIINSSLDAIVTADANSVITGWSHQAEAIFGWPAAVAVGKNLTETLIPHRYREAHQRGLERYLATGEGPILNRRIEITALRRDGREFPVELTVAPVRAGGRIAFSAFLRDLTEQKRTESRIAAEHAVTRILAESHTLKEAAPRVLAAIGQALDWEVGVFWSVDTIAERLRAVAIWHRPDATSPAFVTANQHILFARGVGVPGRVWEDGEPVWIADVTHESNFPRVTEAAEAGLHGALAFPIRAGDEVLGVIEFFHRDVVTPEERLLQSVQVIGSDIGQSIRRVRAEEERDQTLKALEQANAQLVERTAEAEAANRVKSEFLANMSHELRTPLNAIIGYGDLLRMGIAGPITDAQRAPLERIQASSTHLLGLIEDVLDLSKIEAGRITVERQPRPIFSVVDAALELVRPQAAKRKLEILNQCEGKANGRFVGDEDRVRQILVNLLSNAVKFTRPGGAIEVSCGANAEPEPDARLQGQGPWVWIRVADTGIGIASEQLDSVFQPFVQADSGRTRAAEGTGLGLTISRRLARLMDGDLTVESEPGVGSRFTLWLPAASPTE